MSRNLGWAIQEGSVAKSKPKWYMPFSFVLWLLAPRRMLEVMPVVMQPSWNPEAPA